MVQLPAKSDTCTQASEYFLCTVAATEVDDGLHGYTEQARYSECAHHTVSARFKMRLLHFMACPL